MGSLGTCMGRRADWLKGRFATRKDKDGKDKAMMNEKGIPVSRWIDGVLEAKENIDQPDNVRAMVFWGHAPNSQTRLPDMQKAMAKLDLLVVVDPYPTMSAVMHGRKDGVYLLPAATQFETYGSVTASNRSLQWRDKIMEPLFESCRTTSSCRCLPRSSALPIASSATSRSKKPRSAH